MRLILLCLTAAVAHAQLTPEIPTLGCVNGIRIWGVAGNFVPGGKGCEYEWNSADLRHISTEEGDFAVSPEGDVWRLPRAVDVRPLTLYIVDARGVESAVEGSFVDAGTAAARDFLDTRMRIRNTGQATVTVQPIRLAGTGFSLIGTPTGVQLLTPGANIDFRIRFQPPAFGSYSATLTINDLVLIVRGNSPAGLAVSLSGGTLDPDQPVDFGAVESGSSSVRRFVLRNDGSNAMTVQVIRASPPFEAPSGPLAIGAGDQKEVEVRFAPVRPGVFSGTLELDARSLRLQGLGTDPPVPPAAMAVAPAASGQQITAGLTFQSPVRVAGTVTLRLVFEPAAAGAPDDQGILFPASGSRTLQLAVAPGDVRKDVVIQTGTTAGRLGVRMEAGRQLVSADVAIAAEPVRITGTRLVRSPTGVDLDLTGFDNTRSVLEARFQFFNRDGQPLTPEPIRVQLSEAFERHFQSSRMGGMFVVRASFPVAGDAQLVGGVQTEIVNSVGVAQTGRTSYAPN